jgi:hypothetical protein
VEVVATAVVDVAAAVGAAAAVDVVAKGNRMNPGMNKLTLVSIGVCAAIALGATHVAAADRATEQVAPTQAKAAAQTQASYASPQQAALALYAAIKSHDVKSIYKVLGPGSANLIYTGDDVADQLMHDKFVAAYDKSLKIEMDGVTKATLVLGDNEWPFPFPLVKGSKGWQFDAKAGAEELVNRHVGENELFTIRFCLAFGDAQREYAEQDRNGNGLLEYAQRFRSGEGKKDGLYWPSKQGEPDSPFGPLVSSAVNEGYSVASPNPSPFHGYYYRILTAQGTHAPGGSYDYLVNGNMIGGFALIAYPSRWGASGVMTFMCSHEGSVYQKDLGADTSEIASKVTRFDPDAGWTRVEQ